MVGDILDKLKAEMKIVPFTVLSLCLLWLAAWGVGLYYRYYFGPAFAVMQTQARDAKETAEEVKKGLEEIKDQLLEQSIFQVRTLYCASSAPETRQWYLQRLSELLTKYQKENGASYPLQRCEPI